MLNIYEKTLFAAMVFFIMIAMGATLTPEGFRQAARSKKAVLIGMLSQFGLMPLFAFLLALAFNLEPAFAVGLILIGCTPGGTTSNLLTYYAGGDVALSITMTVWSTLAAVFMMPLLIFIYASYYSAGSIQVPYANIAGSVLFLVVPVSIGLFIRKKSITAARRLEKAGSVSGIAVLIFLMIALVSKNTGILASTTAAMFSCAIMVAIAGYIFGYTLARKSGLTVRQARTVSLETGIQNGPLTIAVIFLSFEPAAQERMLWMPLLYALFVPFTSSLAALFYRLRPSAPPVIMPARAVED